MKAPILCMLCVAVANLAATIINANALNKANRERMLERKKEKADTGSDSTCS